MNISLEQMNILQELYNQIKDYCLAMSVEGSWCLDYLSTHHDIDIFVITDTIEDRKECVKILWHNKVNFNIIKDLNKQHISISFLTLEQELSTAVWSYIYYFKQPIILFGALNTTIDTFDVFSDEYRAILKIGINKANNYITKYNKIYKHFYHILTCVYILQNNNYTFNDEQLSNINMCHENKDEDKDKILSLIDYCSVYLLEGSNN